MAHDFRRHHFEHSGRPSGTGNLCGLNPALKCRAIVTTSLCDGERDVPVAVFGVAPKTINQPICPTMVWARRPNLHARLVRSLQIVPKKRQKQRARNAK